MFVNIKEGDMGSGDDPGKLDRVATIIANIQLVVNGYVMDEPLQVIIKFRVRNRV